MSAAETEAPAATNSFTDLELSAGTSCSGVRPDSSAASSAAPASMRAATTAVRPLATASCSGVRPNSSAASTAAPNAIKFEAAAVCPFTAATCNGVRPSAAATAAIGGIAARREYDKVEVIVSISKLHVLGIRLGSVFRVPVSHQTVERTRSEPLCAHIEPM